MRLHPTEAGNGGQGVDWDTIPLNTVLYWIGNLFPFNILVKDAGDLTTHAENILVSLLGVPATQDTVVDTQCANITILFARGTSEVGNVGIIVGPEFFDAVAARLSTGSTLAVRGIDYPASISGFLEGGDPDGSQKMADEVSHILEICPDTRLVMAGYSQGGQIVHNAAALLDPSVSGLVSSTVIFGDPKYPQAVAGVPVGRQFVVCHDTDDICAGGDMILLSHLTYAADVDQAANFVVASH
ncbi:cutinase-domain-containing protein [Immersiella caudata]|uniref:cutinase n=1 Tax=Immersiella caudata TaxID=314043 RepID=A0AA40C7J7_9PEZI|nr:cutinase-domain-containing protein [Immersiella caudata]